MAASAGNNNSNSNKGAEAARKHKQKQSLVSRTLERCRTGLSAASHRNNTAAVAPAGCFSVYVGPERERFVVRADRASHPRFRRLLDDAEQEYGYSAQGPLALPSCAVEDFLDVLWHMDHDADAEHDEIEIDGLSLKSPMCGGGLQRAKSGYRALSTARSSPSSFFFSPGSRASPKARGRRSSGS